MYSADISRSFTVALMPRFISTGFFVWPISLSRSKFCMLRAPIWNMSAYLHDERNLPRIHHLGDDRHVVLVADLAQDLQAFLAEPLEAVRAGPRLERAAAQDVRAGLLDLAGDVVENLAALDRARPGDHRQIAAADLDALADDDDGVAVAELLRDIRGSPSCTAS